MGNFRNLGVWTKSKDFAVKIYTLTNKGIISRDFGFKDQIRRSAVSIPSNIAEGDSQGSDKQAIRYFKIAKGSSSELYTQLVIAMEIGYLSNEDSELLDECNLFSAMLQNLIKSRLSK